MKLHQSGNIVPLSYGAQPCMTLPDEFPSDVDYDWYIKKSMQILLDIGYGSVNNTPSLNE